MKTIVFIFSTILAFSTTAQETPPPAIVSPPPSEKPVNIIIVDEGTNEEEESKERDYIYDFPDVYADFKGGPEKMQEWISNNVNYPEEAIKGNIQGKVYISFVVERNGKITNVTVERGVDRYLDREAKRLINNMPKWKVGKKNGKKVRSRCRLPINFTLN